MDTNAFAVFKLFMVGVLVNSWMARSSSATDVLNADLLPRTPMLPMCNETHLLWNMEVCGEGFKREMAHIDPQNWCNLTHFISSPPTTFIRMGGIQYVDIFMGLFMFILQIQYHMFTLCTETNALRIHCFWPNPLTESYIIRIHKHFFSNCTLERIIWVDPPDDTLTILILIPVFLTLAMIALVVWCSKRSDLMA